MKKCGIYCIRNLVNGKRIIGSSRHISRRCGDHKYALNKNLHQNRFLQNSYNKYGEDNFIYEIVCLCQEENLLEFEDHYIKAFDTLNEKYGYNLQTANQVVHSAETRAKISKANKGRVNTPEQIAKMVKAMTGRKLSEEHRVKLSKARKGKKPSIKCIQLLIQRNKDRTGEIRKPEATQKWHETFNNRSEEAKRKTKELQSIAHKGKMLSEQHKIKISMAHLGKPKDPKAVKRMKRTKRLQSARILFHFYVISYFSTLQN